MTCYHCGNYCDPKHPIVFDDKYFCCQGCQTVYEILSANKLDKYYTYEQTPGARPEEAGEKYHFLDNPQIVAKLYLGIGESAEITRRCDTCLS